MAQYTYDALGHRIEFINSIDVSSSSQPTTKRYYYDGQRIAYMEKTAGATTYGYHYAYGNYIDEVLLFRSNTSSSDSYLLHDHLFSSVAYTTLGGIIMNRWEYDAYGNPAVYTRLYSQSSYWSNPFLFTGREVDPPSFL